MDIFNYALQFEKDGEAFYRQAAASFSDKNLAAILIFLAEEEHRHFLLIQDAKRGSAERPATMFISDVTNIFSRMKEEGVQFVDPKATVTDVLLKAMKIEDDSISFYRKVRNEAAVSSAITALTMLEKQEQAHYSLLSSIIEYYETPHLWMEQAEFHNIKDY